MTTCLQRSPSPARRAASPPVAAAVHRRRPMRRRRRRPAATPDQRPLLTHESFALSDEVLAAFTEETGIEVELLLGRRRRQRS